MTVTFDGIEMLFKTVQPLNSPLLISVSFLGSVILRSLGHSAKAREPIDSTLLGMETEARRPQS